MTLQGRKFGPGESALPRSPVEMHRKPSLAQSCLAFQGLQEIFMILSIEVCVAPSCHLTASAL